jgi:hypothetical protein
MSKPDSDIYTFQYLSRWLTSMCMATPTMQVPRLSVQTLGYPENNIIYRAANFLMSDLSFIPIITLQVSIVKHITRTKKEL